MGSHDRLIAGVRRIAVLRANAIGDYVFCLPALDALRAAYPGAEIVLLGRRWHREVLAGRPGPVDRVEVVPHGAGLFGTMTGASNSHPFFQAMRAERFDLALQIHGGGRHSNPFVRQLGARVTAGLQAEDAPALDRTLPYVYFQNEVVRYLETAALVGATSTTLAPRFTAVAEDFAMSLAIVPETNRPIAVLNPGATDMRRRWPADRFVTVGRALASEGALVAVNGSPSEREICSEITGAVGEPAINLAGLLALPGLVGLLARAAVVVSNDTGPLHLANALGTRTVGIFWAFNVANTCPLLRARHRPFAQWDPFCSVCGTDNSRTRCAHDPSFVVDVEAGHVRDAALGFLREAVLEAQPA